MTIRYEGAEFDSVGELVEFKKLMSYTEEATFEESKLQINRKSQPKILKRKIWSEEDISILIKYYDKYLVNKKISKKGIGIIERKLKRTKKAIFKKYWEITKERGKRYRTNLTKKLKLVEKEQNKPSKKTSNGIDKRRVRMKFIGQKVSQMMKLDNCLSYEKAFRMVSQEWSNKTSNKYNKQRKIINKTITTIEFPKIWPLSKTGNDTFESMISNMISRENGKIDYFVAKHSLETIGSISWNGNIWRDFCYNVLNNADKISESLFYLKPKRIKIELEKGYHIITIYS